MTSQWAAPDHEPFEPSPQEPPPGEAFDAGTEPMTAAVPPAPVRRGSSVRSGGGSRWVNVALALALAVAIGGVAFAAGRMTAPQTTGFNGPGAGNGTFGRNFTGNGYFPGGGFRGQGGTGGLGRGLLGGGGGITLDGTVDSVSSDALTITTADGQTIQVALDGSTTYHAQTSATSGDVTSGSKVTIRLGLGGTDDGSGTSTGPTAQDVTIVP
jgi:hypothetical protein